MCAVRLGIPGKVHKFVWLGTLIAGVSGHLDSELSNTFFCLEKFLGGGKVSYL